MVETGLMSIDIDDTLTSTEEAIAEFVVAQVPEIYPKVESVPRGRITRDQNPILYDIRRERLTDPDWIVALQPKPGIVEALEILAYYKLLLGLSARLDTMFGPTLEWLHINRMDKSIDGGRLCLRSENVLHVPFKKGIARAYGVNAAAEDEKIIGPEFAREKIMTILSDTPDNRDVPDSLYLKRFGSEGKVGLVEFAEVLRTHGSFREFQNAHQDAMMGRSRVIW